MKRILSTLLLAAVMCLPTFADSYREALSKYLQTGGMVDAKQYKQMLQPIAENIFPDNIEQGNAILAEYASTQMTEDVTDMFLPAFRNHVSELELNELVATLSDPRFAEIQQRAMAILNDANQSAEFQEFVNQYQMALMLIIQGEKPTDIPVDASIPQNYRQTFMQYYHASKADDIMMSSFRSMTAMLTEALRKEGFEHPEQTVEELIQYTQRNLPNVLISSYYNVLSIKDLQTLTQVAGTPSYQHAMDAVTEVATDPMQLGIALLTKMTDWMYLHFPQYAVPFQQTLDLINTNL